MVGIAQREAEAAFGLAGGADRPGPAAADGSGSAQDGTGEATAGEPEIKGLRSIPYSLATYLLSIGTRLWPLVVVQALLTAFVLLIFGRVTGLLRDRRAFAGTCVALALLTPLPVFTTLAMPDLFAGLFVLAGGLLVFFHGRLAMAERVFLILVLVAAVLSHASHVALALVLLAVTLAAMAAERWRPYLRVPGARWTPLAATLAGALVLNMGVSLASFGEVSMAPKRYPFALARSLADGPARWYLIEECPQSDLAVCEVYRGRELPKYAGDFLFGKSGLDTLATPEQMDRIRAEEQKVVEAALRRYPWHQLQASTENLFQQLAWVQIAPGSFQDDRLDAGGDLVPEAAPTAPRLEWLAWVQAVIAGLSLLAVLLLWPREQRLRGMAAWVLLALLANAAICGLLSAPADRYQARVIWTLTLMALLFAWHRWRGRGKAAADFVGERLTRPRAVSRAAPHERRRHSRRPSPVG